ncbi:dihydrofolate reductase [Paenibacillus koleovorans]|uniref:dihydrofolate reductase n=1 Tax=Paenibacillus koleovorans TaxID=121608 RepID=UPI000FD8DB76|nr:dihydrofolate reductase [Paenibacillus koleovorans]
MSENKPSLSLIWAMDRNRLIGRDNGMPWRLPAEQAYFRRVTTGHTIVMGRKTFESIRSKPLPNRHNVILTRDRSFHAPEGCTVIHSLEEGLRLAEQETVFVIGGSEVYGLFLPYADRLYVTHIDHAFEGDAHFPPYDESAWKEVAREPGLTDEKNPYAYVFSVYERA